VRGSKFKPLWGRPFAHSLFAFMSNEIINHDLNPHFPARDMEWGNECKGVASVSTHAVHASM